MNAFELSLVATGLALVLGLASYAAWLAWRLRGRQRLSAEREASYQALLTQRGSETRDSIAVVCQALVAGDMVATEAALRINYLATQTQLNEAEQDKLAVFFSLAERAAHFPIREAWQALDKPTKRELTRQREQLEADSAGALEYAANGWLAVYRPTGVVH